MGIEVASKIFLLYVLLAMCARGTGGARDLAEEHMQEMKDFHYEGRMDGSEPKEMQTLEHPMDNALPDENNVLRLPGSHGDKMGDGNGTNGLHMHANPLSHLDHMDKSLMVFFTLKDLKVMNKMPIYFPNKDPSRSPQLLPREEANSIPFSYKEYPYLLEFFSFSEGSPQAKAMKDTLRQCEINPIEGETKFCSTSLESMLDFVQKIFGVGTEFKVLSTTHLTKSSTVLENYTILDVPKEIPAPRMVACHTMPYPYAVFYCHSQVSQSKVFVVSLAGDNGDRVEAVAVCHMDTSHWSHNHVSFRVLGIEPGSSHVCHFFPEDNLVYVPMPAMANAVATM